jgi:hypothetical protein
MGVPSLNMRRAATVPDRRHLDPAGSVRVRLRGKQQPNRRLSAADQIGEFSHAHQTTTR